MHPAGQLWLLGIKLFEYSQQIENWLPSSLLWSLLWNNESLHNEKYNCQLPHLPKWESQNTFFRYHGPLSPDKIGPNSWFDDYFGRYLLLIFWSKFWNCLFSTEPKNTIRDGGTTYLLPLLRLQFAAYIATGKTGLFWKIIICFEWIFLILKKINNLFGLSASKTVVTKRLTLISNHSGIISGTYE